MVEKKEKAEKSAEPKKAKPVVKKAEAAAAEPKARKEAAVKRETSAAPVKEKKAVPSGKAVTITQIGSPIGRQGVQRATLIGLGLNKIRRTRTLADTPALRGMIEKVKHLVKVVE